jgi:hypothetical protein
LLCFKCLSLKLIITVTQVNSNFTTTITIAFILIHQQFLHSKISVVYYLINWFNLLLLNHHLHSIEMFFKVKTYLLWVNTKFYYLYNVSLVDHMKP